MNILTKPWFAAVLIVLLQPVVALFLVWQSAPAIVAALAAAAAPAEEPMRPREARAPWNMWTPEIEKIAAELKDVRTALQEREQAVTQREARIAAEQAELARTRKEIELQRTEIGRLLTEIGTDELKNLKSLAQTYSTLTPKGTVAIMAEMLAEIVERAIAALGETRAMLPRAARSRSLRGQEQLVELIELGAAADAEEHWRRHLQHAMKHHGGELNRRVVELLDHG